LGQCNALWPHNCSNSKLVIKLVQAQQVGAKDWDKVMLCGSNTGATARIGLQSCCRYCIGRCWEFEVHKTQQISWTDRHAGDWQTETRQTDRQAGRQAGRQADTQTGRQAGRQTAVTQTCDYTPVTTHL